MDRHILNGGELPWRAAIGIFPQAVFTKKCPQTVHLLKMHFRNAQGTLQACAVDLSQLDAFPMAAIVLRFLGSLK